MIKDPKIPANYQTVMPYLILKDAQRFIDFTQEAFNATATAKVMREERIIMHGEVMVNDSTIMFADATGEFNVQTSGLFVYVNNADETYQKAIEAGAVMVTPLSDQPYGRSGGVKDPCGNTWWITSVK